MSVYPDFITIENINQQINKTSKGQRRKGC